MLFLLFFRHSSLNIIILDGDDVKEGHVWKPSASEKEALTFSLEYDVVRDKYVREGGAVTTKGWRSGVKTSAGIFRKEEKDWGQTYLARAGN